MNKFLFQKLIKKIIEHMYSKIKFRMQFKILNALQKTFKIFFIKNFENLIYCDCFLKYIECIDNDLIIDYSRASCHYSNQKYEIFEYIVL